MTQEEAQERLYQAMDERKELLLQIKTLTNQEDALMKEVRELLWEYPTLHFHRPKS